MSQTDSNQGARTAADRQIPGFRLLSRLGRGGMGSVYRAVQLSLDREVAIKVMPLRLARNPEFRERFFREARAAGRLNHPNIVQGIDAGTAGKFCWIAMELVEGSSVSALRRECGKFEPGEALEIILQVARGLAHAARAGIVHRDVKPENFLRAQDGTVKLCDLGISKVESDATLTQDGRTLGTPLYISPEQARGEHDIDSRSDIYSLGASWYHLVSGQPPFTGETPVVIMTRHITDTPRPIAELVPRLSAPMARVIERMMAKDPQERYPSFEELLEDLEALKADASPPHAGRTRALPAVRAFARARRWALAGGGAVALLALALLLLSPDDPAPETNPDGTASSAPAPPPAETAPPAPSLLAVPAVPEEESAAAERARKARAEAARKAFAELPDRDAPDAARAYEEFLDRYAGTVHAGRIQERLEDMRRGHELPVIDVPTRNPRDTAEALTRIRQGAASAPAGSIRPHLRHPRAAVRALAIDALARVSPAEGRRAALERLRDRNESVRLAAIDRLAGETDAETQNALRRLAEDDPSPLVRERAGEVLGNE